MDIASNIPLIIAIIVVTMIVIYAVKIYNNLITLRNRFKNTFAQIDVQLQRRYDLIPNLVETAKKFMAHEKETLTSVIEARNQAAQAEKNAAAKPDDASAIKSLMAAESLLGNTMGKFFALSEAYPDIKSNQTMQQLMEELTSTENKVGFARQGYNDAVMQYNNTREVFPNNLITGMFSFKEASLFEITDDEAKEAVKVSF